MNEIYSHPGQPEMQVEVILASKGPNQKPIYTFRMRYPRIIHGEIMTHRVFSRNARSSRAVPVKTMLLEVINKPFVPWHWLKNQPGMQGTIQLTLEERSEAERVWLKARDAQVAAVEELFDPDGLNIHKQNPNRLLEAFSWMDCLITTTDIDNFIWLRDHEAAEPHLHDLAKLVVQAVKTAKIESLAPGKWHQPYITGQDVNFAIASGGRFVDDWLNKVSAARCARISYKPFDGDGSYEAELRRYNLLVTSDRVHASPTEHQATPDIRLSDPDEWEEPTLHGNLDGYIQARKLIPNECYRK